jgi:metal-dependent hydrolase (beta-lactamase superfamily II)
MRGIRAVALGAAVFFLPADGFATHLSADMAGAQGSPAADTGYFQIIRPVTKGVWLLAELKFQLQPIGNVTVIEQRDGLVLVDAGGSAGAGRRVVAMVRSLSNKPVKAVIITQWHGDKPQGLSEILKTWPKARTISTAATQEHLRTPATMNTPAAPDEKKNAAFQAQVRDYIAYMSKMQGDAKTDRERQGYADEVRMLQQYMLDMDGALTIATKESFTSSLTH